MKRIVPFAVLLALVCSPVQAKTKGLVVQQSAPVAAAPSTAFDSSIVAVVNDGVITASDLDRRLKLAILASGFPDIPDVRNHLRPQILRALIDEQMQVQEAKKIDVTVSKEEVDDAIAHIGKENGIPGDMKAFIASHGASPDALEAQVRNGLLWNRVVQHELRPNVSVGDDEIETVIERIRANAGKEEFLISEIFLTVDSAKEEEQVRALANNLASELRRGANFSAVARQFSQGASAAQGGDIGWMQQSQMPPEINKALAQAKPGQVSDPIRTASGFHIMGVRDRRTVALGDPAKASVNVMQAFRAYAPGKDKAALQSEASAIRTAVSSCSKLEPTLAASYPGWKAQKLGDINLSKAPKDLAEKLRGIPAGSSSDPLVTDRGIALLFVCSINDGGEVNRDAIMRSIGTEKLELQARRLMRDLRRAAYIDIRTGDASKAE